MAHEIFVMNPSVDWYEIEQWFHSVTDDTALWRVTPTTVRHDMYEDAIQRATIVVVSCDSLATMFKLCWGEHESRLRITTAMASLKI